MFSKVIVWGAGQMGSGIAQVIAQNNISVRLIDLNETVLKKAQEKIKNSLNKLYQKKTVTRTPDKVLQKIKFVSLSEIFETMENKERTTNENVYCDILSSSMRREQLTDSELVIEAVPENTDLKLAVFKQISDMVASDTIIVSNTSSIPLTRLAEAVPHPERVAGLHFMNPVPLMTLVEIIRTKQTTDSVFKKLCQFTKLLEKEAVVSRDRPGFIVNRILMPMINEAVFALQASVAEPEDIDNAMKLGCRHPMGPLALADLIGLDTCFSIMQVLQQGLGDKYAPSHRLKKYTEKGRLGRKTGKGFYTY